MKKLIPLILALLISLTLCSCKSKEARNVEKMIEDIGVVTLECENTIISAEKAYNTLAEEDKSEIENYETLTVARTTLDALIYEAEMNAKYNTAIALLKEKDYESAYNTFVELGNWKDSLDYLDRFTVIENVILSETQILHKNLEELTSVIQYSYDCQGRIIQKQGDYLDYYCFGLGTYNTGNLWTYEYDTNGDLVCVKHYKQDELYLVIDFSYNNHLLVGGSVTTNYQKDNIFFEYNKNGNISRIIFTSGYLSKLSNVDYGWIMDYVYEEGLLVRREYKGWEGELYYETVPGDFFLDNARIYQNNENGQLESWKVVSSMAMDSNVESKFTYGTYYGFDLP